jgi:transcriptional regulator with XRE-family HTH domain
MKDLAAALVVLRHRRGLKQYELADRAGVTRGMLCAYETGKQLPSVRTLSALLEALRFTYADLEEAAAGVARLREQK